MAAPKGAFDLMIISSLQLGDMDARGAGPSVRRRGIETSR